MPPVPDPSWQEYVGDVLAEDYLRPAQNENFRRGVLQPLRRESERSLALERQRLNQAAGGSGRFGGDIWQSLQGRAFELSDRNLNEEIASAKLQQYAFERQLMQAAAQTAAGYQQGIDTANIGAEASKHNARLQAAASRSAAAASSGAALQAAQINAELQRDLLAQQLGFSREELDANLDFARMGLAVDASRIAGQQGLDWAALEQGGGLEALRIMAGLAGEGGQQQLAALGLVPGLEAAGYTGLGAAGGLFSDLAGREAAAAGTANQNAINLWQHQRNNEQQALLDWLGLALPISGVGGTTSGTGYQAGPQQDPLFAGLSQGLSGFLQAQDLFGGGAGVGGIGSSAGGAGGYLGSGGAGTGASTYGTSGARAGAGSSSPGSSGAGASFGGGSSAFGLGGYQPTPGSIFDTLYGNALLGEPGYYALPSAGPITGDTTGVPANTIDPTLALNTGG